MKKNNKKAFTIVELVIVIAVIGVLTAVLIPTFVNLSNKAKAAENQTFVKNINTQLAINEVNEGKNRNAHEAIKDAEKMGFIVPTLTPVDGNDIVWDEVNDRFAIVKSDFASTKSKDSVVYADTGFKTGSDVKLHKLWKVYDSMPATQTYSIYAKGEGWATVGTNENPLTVGFDAGDVKGVESITYARSTGEAQVTTIRANGGRLVVNDTNEQSEQLFFGYADEVEVTTAANCFTSHGTIGTMELKAGKATADSGSFIGLVKAAEGTIAEEKDGGVFVIPEGSTTEDVPASVAENIGYEVSGEAIAATPEKAAVVEAKIEEFAKESADSESDNTVAIIGSKKYESLNDAVEDANSGEVIFLVGDVQLSQDIGDYDGDDTEHLSFIGCLENEVRLLKDVKMTFAGTGTRNIWLQPNGQINPNGHTLTLVGGSVGVSINYFEASASFTTSTITFTEAIAYTAPESGVLGSSLEYSNENEVGVWKWGETSFIFASGAPVENPPGDNPPIWG